MPEKLEETFDPETGRTYVKLPPPTWQFVVEVIRRMAVGSDNSDAISGLLDEINRIAKIVDGDDPDAMVVSRTKPLPDKETNAEAQE